MNWSHKKQPTGTLNTTEKNNEAGGLRCLILAEAGGGAGFVKLVPHRERPRSSREPKLEGAKGHSTAWEWRPQSRGDITRNRSSRAGLLRLEENIGVSGCRPGPRRLNTTTRCACRTWRGRWAGWALGPSSQVLSFSACSLLG